MTDRIFFSDHIGILLNLGYRGYLYPGVEYDASNIESALSAFGFTNVKFSQKVRWNLKGVHLGTGLAIKF